MRIYVYTYVDIITGALQRFKREAKVLAALNHPHIAAIYGFDEAGATQFLVLELVEGETLADRLKRGPVPVDETIVIARRRHSRKRTRRGSSIGI